MIKEFFVKQTLPASALATWGPVREPGERLIGTYLHGPLLPKNAWLADHPTT